MATPLASQLAGLEWGFAGRPFATLHSPGLNTTDPTEWAFQARGFYLVDNVANPLAPRRVTSVRANVLAGNPSVAEGRLTAIRAMVLRASAVPDAPRQVTAARALVLRSSAQEDSQRKVTTLRINVVRTNDMPDAPRKVSSIRVLTLRSNRRGDVARPGVSTFLAFNDTNSGAAEGEFHVDGFVALATKFPAATSRADQPVTVFPNADPVILPVGYSAEVSTGKLLDQINRLLPAPGTFLQANTFNSFGTLIFNSDTVAGPSARFPMSLAMIGGVGSNPPVGFINEESWINNVGLPQPVAGQDIPMTTQGCSPWFDAPPGGYPGTVVGTHVGRLVTNSQSINSGSVTVTDHLTNCRESYGTSVGYAPRVTLAIRPGKGAVRVVKWVPGFTTVSALPPFPGVTADFSFMEGQTFASMDALVTFLLTQAAFTPNTLVDTLGQNLRFVNGANASFSGLIYKPWATYLGATANTPQVGTSVISRDKFDDGAYNNNGIQRYRRLKTLRLHPAIVVPGPVVGNSIAYGWGNETYSSLHVNNSFRWDAPGGSVSGSYRMPSLFVEKLDSPSTHFNDPLGTTGVDD